MNHPSPSSQPAAAPRRRLSARLSPALGLLLALALLTAMWIGAQASTAAALGVARPLAREAQQGCTPTVTAIGQVNVRFGPSTNFNPPLGVMFPGQSAPVTGRLSDATWYRVVFNGQEGWVFSQLVSPFCIDNVPVVPAPPPPAGPTPGPGNANFTASATNIAPGQCVTLSWNVTEVAAVYLSDGVYQYPVGGVDSRQFCPTQTTTYTLTVTRRDGSSFQQSITVTVGAAPPVNDPNFRADAYSLNPGQCTTMRWNVGNVRAVFFWDGTNQQGVGGNDSRQVCPLNTTTYRLQVIGNDGTSSDFFQTITVAGGTAGPSVSFSAGNSEIPRGSCTTLTWQVSGAFNSVLLIDSSAGSTTVVGPTATIQVCPQQSATYILRVIGTDGRQYDNSATVNVFIPAP